ncbi:MAG: hypothetical protein AAF628_30490 [Planctomycetota bacterium]
MAAKKKAGAMDFIIAQLKKNPKAEYASIKERADKQGLPVYPIMYGRAKALLGLVKVSPRGKGKKATARKATGRGPGRPRKVTGRGPGRPPRSAAAAAPLDAIRDLVSNMRDTERANEDLRRTLEKIRELIDRAI